MHSFLGQSKSKRDMDNAIWFAQSHWHELNQKHKDVPVNKIQELTSDATVHTRPRMLSVNEHTIPQYLADIPAAKNIVRVLSASKTRIAVRQSDDGHEAPCTTAD